MAEYINRQEAKSLLHIEYAYAAEQLLDEIPAADVAPVVHGIWAHLGGMNGAALRAALLSPLKAVGTSLPKNTARIAGRKWTEGIVDG